MLQKGDKVNILKSDGGRHRYSGRYKTGTIRNVRNNAMIADVIITSYAENQPRPELSCHLGQAIPFDLVDLELIELSSKEFNIKYLNI